MSQKVTLEILVKDGGSFKTVSINAEGLRSSLSSVVSEAKRLSGSFVSSIKGMIGPMAAAAAAGTAVVNAIRGAVTTIATFERSNATLASVLGVTTQEVADMSQAAKELGRVTEFTASNVTELQTSLARLGFNKDQILAMQEPVLKFASAVGTDLASAADFTGSALRAFGLKANDTGSLLDQMAAATSKSALDFSKLQTSIAIVAPIAKAFGLTVGQTSSFLGVLANNGFDASSAATALRNILLNLADSNGKLANGIGHSAKSFEDIIKAFRELNERGIDVASVLEMTDKRSAAAAQTIIASADAVESLSEELNDCKGSLDSMYDTMTDNVIGATNNLKSAWEGLMLAFEQSKGPIKTVVQWLADALNYMTALVEGRVNDYKFGLEVDATIAQNNTAGIGDYENYIAGIDKAKKELAELKKQEAEWTWDGADWAVNPFSEKVKAAQHAVDILIAAKDKLYSDLEFIGPVIVPPPVASPTGNGPGPGGDGKKAGGLTEDLEKYNLAVQRAVESARALGGSKQDVTAQVRAMGTGLTALISKYGVEDERIQALIQDYQRLSGAAKSLTGELPKLDKLDWKKAASDAVKLDNPTRQVRTFISEATKVDAARNSISALGGAFQSLSGAVGESAAAWIDWIGNLLSAIAQAIPAIYQLVTAKRAEATANMTAAATGAASSVASIPLAGPIMAVAAVASVIATLASLPKFASGAMVYGPTLGLFGEYPGASSNPEVVAPLDKLQGMIGSAGMAGEVNFRIAGRDLVGVLNRETKIQTRG